MNSELSLVISSSVQTSVSMNKIVKKSYHKHIAYLLYAYLVILAIFDWLVTYNILDIKYSQVTRGLLLLTFLYYIIRTNVSWSAYNFNLGKILFAMAVLTGIYAILEPDLPSGLYYWVRFLVWPCGAIVFYRLVLNRVINENLLLNAIYLIIIICVSFTIHYLSTPNLPIAQNASAYTLLWILPFILLKRNSKLFIPIFIITCIGILLPIKRGAIISLIISLVAYSISMAYLKRRLKNALNILFILVVFISVFVLFYQREYERIYLRTRDFYEPDKFGSGRAKMYSALFQHWYDANPFQIIFGFGSRSVQIYTGWYFAGTESGPYAHSDWLGFLHDYGILGILIMIWLHLYLIKIIILLIKKRHFYLTVFLISYAILFCVNIYSGQLMSPNTIYFGIFVSYILARLKLEQHEQINRNNKI